MTGLDFFLALQELPLAYYLFFLCQFFVGAIVGVSIAKNSRSALLGMVTTLFLSLGVIIYFVVVGKLPTVPPTQLFQAVLSTLFLLFFLWGICVAVACFGYWIAYLASWSFGVGNGRITLLSILGLITVLAAVAALTRIE